MINIEDETGKLRTNHEILIEKAIKTALDYQAFNFNYDVNFICVDNAAIKEINNDYRQIDKATDVLSFPMIEWDILGDYNQIHREKHLLSDPDTGNILLGDIIMSFEKAENQANEYGHSLEREVSFLIVHSILHLLGYDHMNEDDEKVMIQKQKEIMLLLAL